MEKNNVLLDRSVMDAMSKMSPEMGYEFVMGLMRYGIEGVEPSFKNKMLEVIFIPFKSKMDYNIERYERCVENGKKGAEFGEKGAEFGKRGGRPRKGETREEYVERRHLKPPQETPLTVTGTVTENDTGTGNVIIPGNDNEKEKRVLERNITSKKENSENFENEFLENEEMRNVVFVVPQGSKFTPLERNEF